MIRLLDASLGSRIDGHSPSHVQRAPVGAPERDALVRMSNWHGRARAGACGLDELVGER